MKQSKMCLNVACLILYILGNSVLDIIMVLLAIFSLPHWLYQNKDDANGENAFNKSTVKHLKHCAGT